MKYLKTLMQVLWAFLLFTHCQSQNPNAPSESVMVALYSGPGTAEECVKATENMFRWIGCKVTMLGADSINDKSLRGYDILCIPGGNMYQYAQDISSSGKEKIRNYIRAGGSYIGICGGAYFASEKVIWQGSQLPMESLSLFSGTAEGVIDEIVPYPDYGMCRVDIVDSLHPVTRSEPDSIWILYYWGPALTPDLGCDATILADYEKVNLPAMLAFEYGDGRVFLVGVHPEFEEDSDRDGVTLADELDDRGSEWEMMKRAVLWCLKKLARLHHRQHECEEFCMGPRTAEVLVTGGEK